LGQALQTFDIGWLDDLGRGLNDVGRGLNAFFEGFWGDQSEEGIKNIEKARDMTGLLIDQIEDAAGADGFRYLLMETNVDTGEREEVGEILESRDGPNDASRWWARIMVDGEEYEAWIDKETGDITQIPVEVEIDSKSEKKTRKTIDKIIDGLEGMDKVLKNSRFPILGELSGFALDAARSIDSLQEHFGYFRRLGLDPVEAGLQSIGHVFPRFADEARALQVRWINLTDSFRQFRAQGLNPVEAGILALGQAFPSLQTAMTGLYGVVDGLGDAFGAAIRGDWSAAFDGLAQAARSAGVVVGEIAGAVADLAVDLFNWTINVGAPRVIGWLADHAGDIWAGLQAAVGWVWDGLVELGGWVLNTAVPAVTGWVADNAGSIWNALSTAAGWVWDGLVDLGSWVITTAAPQVAGWMASASGNLWNALATAAGWVWSGVVDMPNWVLNTVAPTVAGWLTGIGEWLRTKIVEGLASFGITSTDLITVGTSIASALGEAVTLGLQSVADCGAPVLTWLTEQMEGIDGNSLGNTIGTKLGEAIKLGIPGLAGLIGLGAYLLAELLLAIVDVDWSSLGSSIKAFLETALEAGF